MKVKKNFLSIFIIICFCYLFFVTVAEAYGFNIDIFSLTTKRAPLLIFVLFIGLINVLFRGIFLYNGVIASGFLFSFYIFFVGIFTYSKYYDIGFFVSCSIMWFCIMFVIYNIELTQNQLEVRNNILTVFLCVLSVLYIMGNIAGNVKTSVLSINSIYYVVTAIPFLFLCKSMVLQTVAFLLSSGALLISGKSIAFVIWVFVCVVFYRNVILQSITSFNKGALNFIFVIVCIIIGWNFIKSNLKSDSLEQLFTNFFDELDSGGNGRFDVFDLVFSEFKKSPIKFKLFGHGFFAIDKEIGTGSHNDFLMVLYNYGIIGLVLYINFLIQLIRECLYLKRNNSAFYTAYFVSVVIFIIISMGSNIINSQLQCLLLCVFWGLFSYKKMEKTEALGG